nr:MAG TPA: hypothetical protein [Caudoviricetes sp.]DAN67061.1 MAG TPA: hypothetical protein [Caudoviricetes sp.]
MKPLDYYLFNYALTASKSRRFLYCPSIEDTKSYGKYSRGRL